MTWALQRQLLYIIILILIFSLLGFFFLSSVFSKPPTCEDGKQNGGESGVDCGGLCKRACLAQVDEISILWARSFKVVPGRYNAVAYVENHNPSEAVSKINYRFRFADENNVYIGKREGSTYIPPSGRFAIFEPGIDSGNSVPVYTTFEFTETPEWIRISPEKMRDIRVTVSDINLTGEKESPALSAMIKNDSLFFLKDVDVVAILYGKDKNVVSASRTYLELLRPEESKDIHFTWPEPLPAEVVTKEIIPIYNIDLAEHRQ